MNPISNDVPRTIIDMSPKQELFNINNDYPSLDHCIDDARANSNELFSITSLIRGLIKLIRKRKDS